MLGKKKKYHGLRVRITKEKEINQEWLQAGD